MKSKFYNIILFLVASLIFFSCEKEEIGGTATQDTAGEWMVTVVAIDQDGEIVFTDDQLFGLGHFHFDTYNTAANTSEMWIDDHGTFWEFKVKVDVDVANLTFETPDSVQNTYYDCKVLVEDGKIMYGAATTPSGAAADSINLIVSFSDDGYPAAYDFYAYRIAGYRYTGLAADD